MRASSWVKQSLAIMLAILLCGARLPATALADGEDGDDVVYASTSGATLTVTELSQTVQIETYLTAPDTSTVGIQSCDIIFVLDQSRWMNTETDNGAQREAIITAMHDLLEHLEEPTDGGEHRIAIAGYGRVNLRAIDSYDASVFPGKTTSANNISFNTGYYTSSGFVSQNGWSDVSDMTTSNLPQMPASYRNAMTYENAFMTIDEAEEVLDPAVMMAWYSGASRMDAGLTIAEQLATVARENSEDRNLLVCLITSSLPIQSTPTNGQNVIRSGAVLAASNLLKAQGATIFAFGDYHASGKVISGSMQDTEENFDAVMRQVCSQPDYFFPLSDYANVHDAMNELITDITLSSMEEALVDTIVTADTLSVAGDEEQSITWAELLSQYQGEMASRIKAATATVTAYNFVAYEEDGTPIFESESSMSSAVPVSSMMTEDDTLAFAAEIVPLPSPTGMAEEKTYGYKLVITFTVPLLAAWRVEHYAEQLSGGYSLLEVEDWQYGAVGSVVSAATKAPAHYQVNTALSTLSGTLAASCEPGDDEALALTVYYDWERVTLAYDLAGGTPGNFDYSDQTVPYGTALTVQEAPTREGYVFAGWQAEGVDYQPGDCLTMTASTVLVAQWNPIPAPLGPIMAAYQVEHYLQQLDGSYVLQQTEFPLYGEVGTTVEATTQPPENTHVNTEMSSLSKLLFAPVVSDEGVDILTLQVYYDLDTVTLTYDLAGGTAGSLDYSDQTVPYGTVLTVQEAPTRSNFVFKGWSDGEQTYAVGDLLTMTADQTLTAVWEPLIPPEGLSLEWLPSLLLLLIGAGGITVWAVIRRKKHQKK